MNKILKFWLIYQHANSTWQRLLEMLYQWSLLLIQIRLIIIYIFHNRSLFFPTELMGLEMMDQWMTGIRLESRLSVWVHDHINNISDSKYILLVHSTRLIPTWRWDLVTEAAHFMASFKISPQRAAKSFTMLWTTNTKHFKTLDSDWAHIHGSEAASVSPLAPHACLGQLFCMECRECRSTAGLCGCPV